MPQASVLVSAYVQPSLADALRTRAAEEDRSVSATLRLAVRHYLNVPSNGESPAAATGPGSRDNSGVKVADNVSPPV